MPQEEESGGRPSKTKRNQTMKQIYFKIMAIIDDLGACKLSLSTKRNAVSTELIICRSRVTHTDITQEPHELIEPASYSTLNNIDTSLDILVELDESHSMYRATQFQNVTDEFGTKTPLTHDQSVESTMCTVSDLPPPVEQLQSTFSSNLSSPRAANHSVSSQKRTHVDRQQELLQVSQSSDTASGVLSMNTSGLIPSASTCDQQLISAHVASQRLLTEKAEISDAVDGKGEKTHVNGWKNSGAADHHHHPSSLSLRADVGSLQKHQFKQVEAFIGITLEQLAFVVSHEGLVKQLLRQTMAMVKAKGWVHGLTDQDVHNATDHLRLKLREDSSGRSARAIVQLKASFSEQRVLAKTPASLGPHPCHKIPFIAGLYRLEHDSSKPKLWLRTKTCSKLKEALRHESPRSPQLRCLTVEMVSPYAPRVVSARKTGNACEVVTANDRQKASLPARVPVRSKRATQALMRTKSLVLSSAILRTLSTTMN